MLFSDWLEEPIDIRRAFSCTACIMCSVQKLNNVMTISVSYCTTLLSYMVKVICKNANFNKWHKPGHFKVFGFIQNKTAQLYLAFKQNIFSKDLIKQKLLPKN